VRWRRHGDGDDLGADERLRRPKISPHSHSSRPPVATGTQPGATLGSRREADGPGTQFDWQRSTSNLLADRIRATLDTSASLEQRRQRRDPSSRQLQWSRATKYWKRWLKTQAGSAAPRPCRASQSVCYSHGSTTSPSGDWNSRKSQRPRSRLPITPVRELTKASRIADRHATLLREPKILRQGRSATRDHSTW